MFSYTVKIFVWENYLNILKVHHAPSNHVSYIQTLRFSPQFDNNFANKGFKFQLFSSDNVFQIQKKIQNETKFSKT